MILIFRFCFYFFLVKVLFLFVLLVIEGFVLLGMLIGCDEVCGIVGRNFGKEGCDGFDDLLVILFIRLFDLGIIGSLLYGSGICCMCVYVENVFGWWEK